MKNAYSIAVKSAEYSENIASSSEEQNATIHEVSSVASTLSAMAEELKKRLIVLNSNFSRMEQTIAIVNLYLHQSMRK